MPINRLISAIDDNRCQSMTIDNHTHLDDRLFIDYQYQSINWHRLSSNAIDSHRSSISSIGYALVIATGCIDLADYISETNKTFEITVTLKPAMKNVLSGTMEFNLTSVMLEDGIP